MLSSIFGNWKLILIWLLSLAIFSSVYMFWDHYQDIIDSNTQYKKQIGQLETSIGVQSITISAQEKALLEFVNAQEQYQKDMEDMRNDQIRAQAEVRRLQKLFAEHDFNSLLQKKPTAIERLINAGSTRAFRMLECASGAEYTDCPD